ncbi:protein of unknown function [Methylocaldum szegediense]|uniref:Uncharacterized protein n=1 Tax=Methylocaldum szegediense TaxID=73780 RepID=A0ABM9I7F2_9GAMM|nr:protein of unknown function [Methylocaldum szegediense]
MRQSAPGIRPTANGGAEKPRKGVKKPAKVIENLLFRPKKIVRRSARENMGEFVTVLLLGSILTFQYVGT